jgi:ferritin
MNLDPSLAEMLNVQMNRELANQTAYEALEAPLKNAAWDGMAKFMHNSGQDEFQHYEKFNDFLVDRNCQPILQNLGAVPPAGSSDPYAAFQSALQLERENTERIESLAMACKNVGDDDAYLWLSWALAEQRTSEKELTDILNWLTRAGGNDASLRQIDEKLGEK